MKYGSIEDIVLLGGGELLRQICLWATSESIPIKVVTAPRQAEEVLDGESLEGFLSRHEINHLVVDKISDESAKKFIGDTSKSFCLSLGAAWIFKAEIISSYFDNKLFNLHGTRLPQNRGGGGHSWHIMMGNKLGFCVLRIWQWHLQFLLVLEELTGGALSFSGLINHFVVKRILFQTSQ